MKIHRRQRMYSLLELTATLQAMPDEISVWLEGVGEPYCWGNLREFREEAAAMLAYDRASYPAMLRIDGRMHPVCGLDVHGTRLVMLLLPELPIPDLSRRRRVPAPA
jgi:hypothetical protein